MRKQLELPNEVASELAGPGDTIMKTLEGHLECDVFLRGNVLTLDGGEGEVAMAETVVRELSDLVRQGHEIAPGTIDAIADALQKAEKDNGADPVEVLQRERKRRLEAAEAYRDGGRGEAAEAEEREAEIISSYMPEQLSDEDLHAIVGDAVAESGASSPQEMGKVMSVVMPQVKGRADGKRVSAAVKEMLTP